MFPCRGGWVGKWVVGVENDISGRESHYSDVISNPKNLSEEGFQLFSCQAWPSEVENKYWYCYHQSVQTPLDYLIFVSWSWIPNFSILGYV